MLCLLYNHSYLARAVFQQLAVPPVIWEDGEERKK
jgi:hypothetical protein